MRNVYILISFILIYVKKSQKQKYVKLRNICKYEESEGHCQNKFDKL